MLEPRFFVMKGGGERKDHSAVLDGLAPAGGEAAAVAKAMDIVDDRRRGIAAEQEIGVQRMRDRVLDGALGGDQSLGDDQPAENALPADLRTAPAKKVLLDLFEIENGQKIGDRL